MEVDATLYAVIAKHIALSNDWKNLIGDGHDWLDKPHLPFWIIALSYKVFGINDFPYKLPAFISFLAGVYYCYRIATALYDTATARLATIIYITSLHLFLAVFDVRAEAYLTTFIIAATYHLFKALPQKFSMHIVWAAIFCAAAVMTKGIFVLASIASGMIIYWIYNKQWTAFLQPKWWLMIVLTVVFILPELYCLYQQFDMHPEKVVFGQKNVSGIRFFFWDSQFGRFLNNGPIKGEGDPFFFLHTFLWAFLPWALIAYVATFYNFKRLNKVNSQSLIISGSAVITFLLFSLSKFQLPHYIVIVFPHFAIITAVYLLGLKNTAVLRRWNIAQTVLFFIAISVVVALTFITDFNPVQWPVLLVIVVAISFFIFFKGNSLTDLVGKSVCFSGVLFCYLNLFFYPALLEYQGGKLAGKFCSAAGYKTAVMYNCSSYAFEWNGPVTVLRSSVIDTLSSALKKERKIIVFTTPENLKSLTKEVASVKEIYRAANFHISGLTLPFLTASTREKELGYYLVFECVLK